MPHNYDCRRFGVETLSLKDSRPIGMGNRRRVFVHPQHADLCIKVARHAHIRRSLDRRGLFHRLIPTYWRDDNWLEAKAYQQKALANPASPNWRYVPRLYGWQQTDLGPGLVFDLYRDSAGCPAQNLEQILALGQPSARVQAAVDDLQAFLKTSDLWMRHPAPKNIVLAADGRLKLIDCLGTHNLRLVQQLPAVQSRRRVRHINYLDTAINRQRLGV